MGAREWAMLAALSLLWGGSFFFVAVALHAFPPFTLVALRVGLAALCLLVVLRLIGLRLPRGREPWLAFVGMGLLNNALPFSLIVWGQTQIASGLAAILNATSPLATVLVAHLCTRDERLTANRVAGVVIGLLGVGVMLGPAALAGPGGPMLAQLACLGAALSYACASVFGRRFARLGIAPLQGAAGQLLASSAILLPQALLLDHPWHLALPDLRAWAAVAGLALLSTALAYILYFRLLRAAGAVNLQLVTFLIPVSAILLGVLVLGERLTALQLAGMALIAAGLAAIDGRLIRLARASVRPPA
ncbi:MAG: DMT family transporter [Geminicoccaceae bacterium]